MREMTRLSLSAGEISSKVSSLLNLLYTMTIQLAGEKFQQAQAQSTKTRLNIYTYIYIYMYIHIYT